MGLRVLERLAKPLLPLSVDLARVEHSFDTVNTELAAAVGDLRGQVERGHLLHQRQTSLLIFSGLL